MNKDPKVQCPSCKGSGHGHVNLLDEWDNYVSDIGPCDICGGSGYVSKSHRAEINSQSNSDQPSNMESDELPF